MSNPDLIEVVNKSSETLETLYGLVDEGPAKDLIILQLMQNNAALKEASEN